MVKKSGGMEMLRGICFSLLFAVTVSDIANPELYLWPIPQSVKCSSDIVYAVSDNFDFQGTGAGGELATLTGAFERYRKFISPATLKTPAMDVNVTALNMLVVDVASSDETLSLETDESYTIEFNGSSAELKAPTVYGALRGIETFSQLVQQDDSGAYYVGACTISDKPRFQFRSILVDTARHFIPLEVLLQHVEVMGYNKFNVLHWHIIDDQSFPYESYTFPELSDKGAYDHNHVYSQSDVARLIEFARQRGVRVIPEFDSPGHSQSWGKGQPGLLTPCYNSNKPPTPNGQYGPIDPITESTYTFLEAFYKEITTVFPDQYVHLGGDEVSFGCWASNPDIQKWLVTHNATTNYAKLEEYYVQRLIDIAGGLSKSYLVWQDIFDNGVKIKNDTVISVWKGGSGMAAEMAKVTAAGYKIVMSGCWYLNNISYGDDWEKYYGCDPQDFNGTDTQKDLVMGGGAAMWSEYVDSTNLLSRMWPRASSVAEKLWSAASQTTNAGAASARLNNHRCHLIRRGVPAEPLYPSFCPEEYLPPPMP